jgi:hypothetical protein
VDHLWSFSSTFLGMLATAVLARRVFDELTGALPSMRQSLLAVQARILSVLGLILLGAFGVVAGVLLRDWWDPDPRSVGVAGFLNFGVSALVGALFWVAVPVAIMERTPVVASLLRSLELTRARYPAVLALYLLLSVLLIGAAFLMMIPMCCMGGPAVTSAPASSPAVSPEQVRRFALGFQAAFVLHSSWSAVLTTVVYHDLRVAREGGTVRPVGDDATGTHAAT